MTAILHDTDHHSAVRSLAVRAKEASRTLAGAAPRTKTEALTQIAAALEREAAKILAANAIDLDFAKAQGTLGGSLLERLRLDAAKVATMAAQVRAVAACDDPVGRVLEPVQMDRGLEWHRVSCPLGVILAIVEARPDAVTQIAALTIKSGNALILKAGTEARHTARTIADIIHRTLADGPIPPQAVTLVDDRAAVDALLELDELVDLVVPRGSTALVRSIMRRTRIPVLGHAAGVCHVYVDAAADSDMAIAIVLDAKTQYPAACNSVETVLIHADAARRLLGPLVTRLASASVEVRGCARTLTYLTDSSIKEAAPNDWGHEFGDLVLAIRVVDDVQAAVAHINNYGSGHTEAIVTADAAAAVYFLAQVDAAGVFHNASTRFADGYRYGFGAEVGISTNKLHARGPVGLGGLTTYKYVLYGHGHVVAPYTGSGARPFHHVSLDPREVKGRITAAS
jgi:glutamate-5-semialdehyde dehydrogenase